MPSAHPAPRPDVFRAIADPTRRALLDRLRAGPTPVNALASEFDQSRPPSPSTCASSVRRDSSTEQRIGRERLYQLQPAALKPVVGLD